MAVFELPASVAIPAKVHTRVHSHTEGPLVSVSPAGPRPPTGHHRGRQPGAARPSPRARRGFLWQPVGVIEHGRTQVVARYNVNDAALKFVR